MKKLIVGAALVAAAVAGADTVRIPEKNADGVLVTNEYDSVAYAQKLIQKKAESKLPDIWSKPYYILTRDTVTPEVQAQIDALLSAKRFYTDNLRLAEKYPKMFANYAKVYADDCPELVPLCEYVVANPKAWDSKFKISVVNLYWTLFSKHLITDGHIRNLLNIAPYAIKHKIRGEGKSFVEKDGVNPVQVFVDKLSAALNAPRLAGLDAAMRECGMDFGLTFGDKLLAADEIAELRTKILNGYTAFNGHFGAQLRTHLGIDEYNRFVKLYNEGE